MKDTLSVLLQRWRAGERQALSLVVGTSSSAPLGPGAAMAVDEEGRVIGSVSGGCVEGAVYEQCQSILGGALADRTTYGFSDSDAFSVGLTCGGEIDIFTQLVDRETHPHLEAFLSAALDGEPVAYAVLVRHDDAGALGRSMLVTAGERHGSLGSGSLDGAVDVDSRALLANGSSRVLTYSSEGVRLGTDVEVFVWTFVPPPRLIVFGAIDYAAALAKLGRFLGFRVTVCDARPVFSTADRFPGAHEVITEWPHRYLARQAEDGLIDRRTTLCVLTHDAKFDVPVLEVALRLPDVGYIGAMGSRRTHEDRLRRLREAGVADEEMARLHSPIGLDLGASTPEETAMSILAEVLVERTGRSALGLVETGGPIRVMPADSEL